MPKTIRVIAPLTVLLLAVAVAGCGSSSTAQGIQQVPSSGPTQATAAPATTATTSTTASTPTPTSGPLSKKPVVVVPKGPAPTKLVKKDLITGTGKTATPGATVTVNYVGVLYKDGKEFDSSWSRNQTFTTPLTNGSVIPGWVQGIPGMKVGGRRELIIPSNLAYGKAGSGSTIPPNSTLVFVVDLLSVA
jgi:peptidylprolyl isomerase